MSMVIHDTKCPYWDQLSLNNTTLNLKHKLFWYRCMLVPITRLTALGFWFWLDDLQLVRRAWRLSWHRMSLLRPGVTGFKISFTDIQAWEILIQMDISKMIMEFCQKSLQNNSPQLLIELEYAKPTIRLQLALIIRSINVNSIWHTSLVKAENEWVTLHKSGFSEVGNCNPVIIQWLRP